MTPQRPDPDHPTSVPHLPEPPQAALALLLGGCETAQDLGLDPWDFALDLDSLKEAGLTCNQLRWMLSKGYVAQAIEHSRPHTDRRQFQPVKNLRLWKRACFVLTESGVGFARGRQGNGGRQRERDNPGPGSVPTWDGGRRELRVGRVVVKRFKQPALNQERILAAFEEEGWPPRIEDPLPVGAGLDPKRRLHSTISNLNRSQLSRRIHFEGGGDGQSVCWRLLAPRRRSDARARTRRR